MKIDILLGFLLLWWAVGSIHTAAMTAANVLMNRQLNFGSKARYVLIGGPPVWTVCLICLAVALVMSAIYRFKNRHVEKGSKS